MNVSALSECRLYYMDNQFLVKSSNTKFKQNLLNNSRITTCVLRTLRAIHCYKVILFATKLFVPTELPYSGIVTYLTLKRPW
jgi:hypothetical protein